ncbi:recombinase family protein [Corynebacterium kefirresidentii]|uniref:recombinase family protein n=1 Tax=Corynebacterium TaxID=1716 RepID=UPI0003B8733A|nr:MULTISPECIES: recombinase family protein [unclassified Corynebacterium]ERS78422.1 hypothetical protein HMPREF1285_01660 [Corynebacterium sp. KPL1859]KXB49062.1 resolvase protein [Corynebacterium kroppenstedtii]MDU7511678.1 recombinase family protein [Corynebacterium sp.]MDU7565070.1 recombinase family protein [Corynebacterium sp.]
MVKAAIYARISLDKSQEGVGVERQEAICRKFCKERKYEVAGVFADNSLSAYHQVQRSRYERLIEAITDGQIEVVVVYHQDRLTRSLEELLAFMKVIRKHEVRLESVVGGTIDAGNPDSFLTASILGTIAQFESMHKATRVRSAMRRKVERGGFNHSRRLFGYDVQGKNMAVKAEEATVIREAARKILSGETLYSIANDWNARGFTTTLGNPWRPGAVRDVLRNPKIAGLATWYPTIDGKRSKKNREIVGPGNWEPILEKTLWESVDRILGNPGRMTNGGAGAKAKYLGSGIYLCTCGRPLYVQHRSETNSRGERVANYTCRYRRSGLSKGEPHTARKADVLDRYVTEVVLSRLERSDVQEYFAGALKDDAASERQDLLVQRATVEERLDHVTELYAVGEMDSKRFDAANLKLQEQLIDINDKLDQIMGHVEPGRLLQGVVDIRKWWEEASLEQRRLLLSSVVEVRVLPSRHKRARRKFDPSLIQINFNGAQVR